MDQRNTMRGGHFVYALYGHDHDMHTTLPNCAYMSEDEARKAAENEPENWLIRAIWVCIEEPKPVDNSPFVV